MNRIGLCVVLACLSAAPVLAQDTPPPPTPPSKLWIVAGGASGTLRGHCQECGAILVTSADFGVPCIGSGL